MLLRSSLTGAVFVVGLSEGEALDELVSWSNSLRKLSNSSRKVSIVPGSSSCAGASLSTALGAAGRDASCFSLVLVVETPIE